MSILLPLMTKPYSEIDFTRMIFDERVDFARSSSATHFDANGNLQTVSANVPRIDHDPFTGEVLGLLIEESRVNRILNSDAPSTQNVSSPAAVTSLSFYGTGSITLSGAYSATLNGTGAFPNRAVLVFTPGAGTITLAITGDVQFAQLEAGAFPTSYMPTTGAAFTRQRDIASIDQSDLKFDPTVGTCFAEFSVEWDTAGGTRMVVITDNNGRLVYSNSDNLARVYDGTNNRNASGAISSGSTYKVASSWGAPGLRIVKDGGTVSAGTAFSGSMGTASIIRLGANTTGSANILCGWIKKLRFWPYQMSGSDLQHLTS